MGMYCRECQWYRPQWGECCFGGGWGHYPKPDDECERYTDDTERDKGINENPHESSNPNHVKKSCKRKRLKRSDIHRSGIIHNIKKNRAKKS